ncbi:MAG: flagellar biosynthesis protein [Caldimonas sp.]
MPTASRNDQAEGLRQMFAHTTAQFVPVVSNPHVAFGGVMLERLCTAFAERGARVLVIDASERASEAGEMALVDLGQCIERLSAQVSYLAARGLAVRFVDASGSTRGFLERAAEAAPGCDLVLVHSSASELCRMFSRVRRGAELAAAAAPCPILLADDSPTSVTHAYASMKLLAARAGLVVSDLLLGAAPHSPRAERIAAKLASCADDFFGAVLRDWARIDPAGDACEAPSEALRRLVDARFANVAHCLPHTNRTFGQHAGHATS